MSDEELRALEHAFEAAPGPDARRALATALVRAGQRRRAVALLADGARAGEPDARAALDAWHPWPGGAGAGGRHRAERAVAGPLVEVATSGVHVELDTVLGATATSLLLLGHGERSDCRVAALDLSTLATRWSVDAGPRAEAALAGDDVVVVSRTRVTTYAADDGALRGALTLPAEGHAVVAADDRVVVLLCRANRARVGLACVDLTGPRPALAWQLEAPAANDPLFVHEDRVQAHQVCVRLVDGAAAPPLPESPPGALRRSAWHVGQTLLATDGQELVVTASAGDAPEVVTTDRVSGEVVWRRALPAWFTGGRRRIAAASAGEDVLVLLVKEDRVALLVLAAADGAPRQEVASTLRGRGDWDHRRPVQPALVVAGGGVLGLVPTAHSYHVHVVRFAAAGAVAPRPRRAPLPGSPTPLVGARVGFEVDATVWRTPDGRPVLPPATCQYDFLWGRGGRVLAPRAPTWTIVTLALPAVVLEPEPVATTLALLVDLVSGRVVALPLPAPLLAVAVVPAGLVVAEGDYTSPSEFDWGGFTDCRLAGLELPSGRRAWTVEVPGARPVALAPRADGTFDAEVQVIRDVSTIIRQEELDTVRRVLDPGVPGWGAPPAPDVALELQASRTWGQEVAAAGLQVAFRWPTPGEAGVLEVRRGDATEVLTLAAALPETGPPSATRGDVEATWADEEVVRVTRGGREVARLVLPRDVRPASIRSAATPRRSGGPRERPEDVRYVPAPPVLLGLCAEGAHVLAVLLPRDERREGPWLAVVWALDEPDAPLGHVPLGPGCLPPPRAVLAGPPGRLRLDLGRGAALVVGLTGPLAGVAWAPAG
jgi:hypothetical protein